MMDVFLQNKRDEEQEYTLHLFTYCNLSCSFCWQDHDSLVGVDDVMGKLSSVEALLQKETKRKVVFNIMGGEVFAPEVFTPELADTYVRFSEAIIDQCRAKNIAVTLNWVTNLVTEDRPLLDDFLERARTLGGSTTVTVSYDPKGRFNRAQLEIFKKNLAYYGPRVVRSVSLLMTKQNIEHFVKDQDEFFSWAYDQGFKLYFDYLMPDEKTNAAPSDHDLLRMFKFLIDHYPNCEPVAGWLRRQPSALSCRSSKLVLEDGTTCGCGNLIDPKVAEEIYEVPLDKTDNSAIEEHFMEKYGCLTCEYFQRCELGCFMQHNYRFREEMDECVYKVTHRYIDSVVEGPDKRIPAMNV
jgi:sulfatase maturation enzyme AslB (radical SAM superfamily)